MTGDFDPLIAPPVEKIPDMSGHIALLDPGVSPFVALLNRLHKPPVNQDYEDAKELIREAVYGDRWHRFLKSKQQPRRSHHRLGERHRSKAGA